ncbi:YcxB family protein [Streptomyces sp. NPDC019443]|uniref:YcxB family protein n=1 Tax=Streptomyces sp. NPDC019443 TaxID=3365061 RepID=UPI003789BD02
MVHPGRDTAHGTDAVELAYRPTRGDILAGIRVRDRIRKLALLRGAVVVLFALFGLRLIVTGAGLGQILLQWLVVFLVWSIPHVQANHVLRTVEWHGEFRATVSDDGISVTTDHCTLTQRWSLFRGYRDTRDHFVLLSRDPNILCLEVLPKSGLRAPEDAIRLQALLDRHLNRA